MCCLADMKARIKKAKEREDEHGKKDITNFRCDTYKKDTFIKNNNNIHMSFASFYSKLHNDDHQTVHQKSVLWPCPFFL